MHDETFCFKGEQCPDCKKSKERFTVTVGCSAEGSQKTAPVCNRKNVNSRCFKNAKKKNNSRRHCKQKKTDGV
jgi:hypothetical protein